MAKGSIAFGPFRLDPMGVVWRDGRALPIGGRGVRLLEALLLRRGEIVSKADLLDAAWHGEIVAENNLSVQIAHLRKSLGDNWIRNVERVGYQFIDAGQALGRNLAPSLAVKPFRDLGGAAEIASAITEEVSTELTRFSSIRVLASTKGTGAPDYVLEGSARREHGRLEVATRLAEERSGHYCWSHRFEIYRSSRLPVALIASMVESQVELAELGAASNQPDGRRAPQLLRRAQALLRISLPDANAEAIVLIDGAGQLEPNNIQYLGAMCEALGTRISMGWTSPEGPDAARLFATASRGLRQPTPDSDALLRFGFGLFRSGDPERGYRLMQRSADLNPHSVRALCLTGHAAMHWSTLDEAESYFTRGLSLDPHHFSRGSIMAGLSRIRMVSRDFEGALGWATRARSANPNYGGTHWTLIAANALLKRREEATQSLERFLKDHPDVTIDRIGSGQPTRGRLATTLEGLQRAGLT